ncbi:MAG: thermonuclease family protein [Alphaproteobacteria bacterium]|nr:thermonuclease family protein [Alphaproteobacteria bacterium]
MKERDLVIKAVGKIIFITAVLLISVLASGLFVAQAQDAPQAVRNVQMDKTWQEHEEEKYEVTIKDVNLLIAGKTKILLWGVERINPNAAVFNLKARNVLEKKIDGKPITCMTQAKKGNVISAQCINHAEDDLSLFMLQQGLVSADRTVIHGSVYEESYLEAEHVAHKNRYGVWAVSEKYSTIPGDKQTKNFMLGAFLLVAVFIMALIVLGFFVMRGFGRVIDVQSRSLDLAMKERDLKEKEKLVIAAMINSEVKENKSKIEAYLLVYEEMLRDFSDSTKPPTYQKTGEVVQKQPALSRVVFDGNTDKLDLFGTEWASDLVHYYARIKTNPDYIEIAPDALIMEVQDIILMAVKNAKKLDDISTLLLEKFADHEALKKLIEDGSI